LHYHLHFASYFEYRVGITRKNTATGFCANNRSPRAKRTRRVLLRKQSPSNYFMESTDEKSLNMSMHTALTGDSGTQPVSNPGRTRQGTEVPRTNPRRRDCRNQRTFRCSDEIQAGAGSLVRSRNAGTHRVGGRFSVSKYYEQHHEGACSSGRT